MKRIRLRPVCALQTVTWTLRLQCIIRLKFVPWCEFRAGRAGWAAGETGGVISGVPDLLEIPLGRGGFAAKT